MRKVLLLSIMASSFILVGCSDSGAKKPRAREPTSSSVKQHNVSQTKASSYNPTQNNSTGDDTNVSSSASSPQDVRVSIVSSNSSSSVDKSSSSSYSSTGTKSTQKDFDLNAINNGDLSTLKGTWENGQGDEITIASDGTSNKGQHIVVRPGSTLHRDTGSVPSVGFIGERTGEAMVLLKIGATNPFGDSSDTNRPCFFLTQSTASTLSDQYYYRK